MFIWLVGGVFQSSLVEWRMLQAVLRLKLSKFKFKFRFKFEFRFSRMLQAVLLRLKLSKFIERHGLPLKSAAVIKKSYVFIKNTFIVLFRVYKDLAIF